jgi:hypothetical protein
MEIFRNLTVVLTITTLVACNDVTIEGSWVESVPGISNLKQGFTLEANGSASSINMATLKYEKWKKEGNLLLLSGISIGNHQSISFTDTLTVEQLTQDSLILKKGELVLRYSKTNEIPDEEAIPTPDTPTQKLLSVKGFTSEGDSTDYWIVDKTGELLQKYDGETKGIKNGTPVYVELEVIDMGKSDEGFAADYAGVYHVMKINKITVK